MSSPSDKSYEEEEGEAPELSGPMRVRMAILLGSILLIAICSITYELIIGTLSSYLLGNSVYQFSLVIGLYLSAMGIGSYLSRYVRKNLLESFFWVELGVGLCGGTCAALLFGIFTFSPYFQVAIWVVTIVIGTLVGLEIPLLMRYIRRYAYLRDAIANVLSWDYIGALAGSIAFPLLLLPGLGLLNTAAVIGLINVAVALFGVWTFRDELRHAKRLAVAGVLTAALLVTLFFTSGAYERFLDKRLFVDPVIYQEQTPYQKLTMTAFKDDIRLFINGNIQFSSKDEYRYHEALVHPVMAAAGGPGGRGVRDVLILGGGDGLAVRQLQAYPDVESIVMVDLDPRMTEIGAEHPVLRRLNEGAMEDPRLEVVNADAMSWIKDTDRRFDAIIIDLPDPNNESLAKLYSNAFYRLIRRTLRPHGAMVTQSSSVYYSPRAFWSIHRTLEDAFCPESGCDPQAPNVVPMHVWVPSFGDWGFNLASARPLRPESWEIEVPTRFLDEETLATAMHFPPDLAERDVEINRLIEPVLLTYYLRDWQSYNP